MTVLKIAVSLPNALVVKARRSVLRKRARSFSAYVADALAEKIKNDDLADLLSEILEETGGPPTDTERSVADAALGIRSKLAGQKR